MTIDFTRLFSSKYLFSSSLPGFLPGVFRLLVVLFSLILILGAVARIVNYKKHSSPLKKFWQKLANCFLAVSLLGFLLIFFRQEQIIFLSMPIWLAALGLLALVWLIFISHYLLVKVPRLKQDIETKKQLEKYLP